MTRHNRYHVLHAPYDVGGNSYHLARAESALGFESRNLVYFRQWLNYPCHKNLRMKPGADPLMKASWWASMYKIVRNCDVLHFNFGGSFLTDVSRGRVFMDLPVWRSFDIATFVTFQGCDSRISKYCVQNFHINGCVDCRSRQFCESTYDNFKSECLSQVGRHFDGVFALNPDLMYNIPGARFLPYSNCDLDVWQPPKGFDWNHGGPVRILHAPTWREIKGSDLIVQAVEELKSEGEGENVELVLAEGIPHDRVRETYDSADIVVDQLLVGWYGGLAVEAMALAKPVVAYIRESDLRFIPRRMQEELPVLNATSTRLKDVLRPLIRSAEKRRNVGERSRRFVEKWHHPSAVAAITTAAYQQAMESHRRQRSKTKHRRVLIETSRRTVKPLLDLYIHSLNLSSRLQSVINRSFRIGFYV
jgi:glycosyltransferase involved in cell wall biosynthesis